MILEIMTIFVLILYIIVVLKQKLFNTQILFVCTLTKFERRHIETLATVVELPEKRDVRGISSHGAAHAQRLVKLRS